MFPTVGNIGGKSEGYNSPSIYSSHTLEAGSSQIVVAHVGAINGSGFSSTPTTVLYNSVAMTLMVGVGFTNGSLTLWNGLYFIKRNNLPSAGTYSIAAGWANDMTSRGIVAFTVNNASQTGYEASASATASAVSVSTNITTITNNCLVLGCPMVGTITSYSYGAGQTGFYDQDIIDGSYKQVATAGVTSVSATRGGSDPQSILAVAIPYSKYLSSQVF